MLILCYSNSNFVPRPGHAYLECVVDHADPDPEPPMTNHDPTTNTTTDHETTVWSYLEVAMSGIMSIANKDLHKLRSSGKVCPDSLS